MDVQTTDDSQQAVARTDDQGALAVERLRAGQRLDEAQERHALDWLLGAPQPAIYNVTVQWETPEGDLAPLTFQFRAMDGRRLDRLERDHVGQDGRMDQINADAAIVAEACEFIADETGRRVVLASDEFRTVRPDMPALASTVLALQARFGTQSALIAHVARAIREACGWSPDRVGRAERVLVTAAGN